MTDTPVKSLGNLKAALAGESMAYQKYMYFAKIARKNGDEDVAALFEATAKHETGHAEGHLRHLYPMNEMTTEDCLRMAIEGEKFEYTEMYPRYAEEARDEGAEDWIVKEFEDGIEECKGHAEQFSARLKKIEKLFNSLTRVEKEHHDNYTKALEGRLAEKSFEQSDEVLTELAAS